MDYRERDVYLNFVGGQWKQGTSGQWTEDRNPAKPSDVLGKATQSTASDISSAIEVAVKAQVEWAKRTRPTRGAILAKAAQVLKHQSETIAKTLTREEGKNLSEARAELAKAVSVLEFVAGEGRRPTGEVVPAETSRTFIYTTRAPLGVVAVITSWNAPVCTPVWKIAPALLEGNSVIFKPSSLTPATAVMLTRVFEEAGVPAGVLNLIHGPGASVGDVLAKDKRVRAISFTGSNDVGRALYAQASQRLARVQLEMGGKNPAIVLADADLDLAVEAIVAGAFGSSGQRCTATSRAIVDRSVHAVFREKLLARVSSLKVGDGMADPTAMGPLADEKQFKAVCEAISQAKEQGLACVFGGETLGTHPVVSGYFVTPTIFDNVPAEAKLAREEIFGPVLAIIPVDGFEEALKVANQASYGLASSVYTKDIQKMMQYADFMEAGILHVNSPAVGGREMGRAAGEFFCELKTVYVDYQR